jgi:CRP/FNR family transcriptional regulator, anaerobic regulatory protein
MSSNGPVTAAAPDFPCRTCEVRDKAICKALDDAELRQLNSISTAVRLDAGGTVFYEGDDSSYLFNVVRGSLRLSKLLPDGRRQVTGFLFPGDFLGLSIGGVYSYTAETLAPTELCRFERARMARMLDRFPKLEHQLLSLASNELSQAQDHIMVLGRKTASERIASVLLKLVDRIGRKANGGCDLDLPMTRSDLADYTGLTTETVSRTLSQLKKKGVIITSGVRDLQIPRLSDLAGYSGDF